MGFLGLERGRVRSQVKHDYKVNTERSGTCNQFCDTKDEQSLAMSRAKSVPQNWSYIPDHLVSDTACIPFTNSERQLLNVI